MTFRDNNLARESRTQAEEIDARRAIEDARRQAEETALRLRAVEEANRKILWSKGSGP